MSISPPSPDGSTGMTSLTLGSALTDTSLIAPVVRSATRADLLSGLMISPLVLSRQPCITPGAGHCFGNGLAGSGGGGVVLVLGACENSGSVVNGACDDSSNRAQPVANRTAALNTASIARSDPRNHMTASMPQKRGLASDR